MRSEVVLNQMVRSSSLSFPPVSEQQADRSLNVQSLSVLPTTKTLSFRLPLLLLLRSTTVLPKHSVQYQPKLPVPLPLLRLLNLLSTFTPSSLEEDRRTLAILPLPLLLSRLNEDLWQLTTLKRAPLNRAPPLFLTTRNCRTLRLHSFQDRSLRRSYLNNSNNLKRSLLPRNTTVNLVLTRVLLPKTSPTETRMVDMEELLQAIADPVRDQDRS